MLSTAVGRPLFAFLQIALTNLLLSSDNVLMIALLSHGERRRRRWVLLWSMVVSLVAQLAVLFLVNLLFRIPGTRSAFGLLICFMAFRLLGEGRAPTGTASEQSTASLTTRIAFGNLMMSFENEAALIALAGGDVWSAWAGICATAPLIFFGSHGMAWLLERYTVIVYAGAVYLFRIGSGLLLSMAWIRPYAGPAGWALTALFAGYAALRYLGTSGAEAGGRIR